MLHSAPDLVDGYAFAVERATGSVEASLAEYLWQGRRLLSYLSGLAR